MNKKKNTKIQNALEIDKKKRGEKRFVSFVSEKREEGSE